LLLINRDVDVIFSRGYVDDSIHDCGSLKKENRTYCSCCFKLAWTEEALSNTYLFLQFCGSTEIVSCKTKSEKRHGANLQTTKDHHLVNLCTGRHCVRGARPLKLEQGHIHIKK